MHNVHIMSFLRDDLLLTPTCIWTLVWTFDCLELDHSKTYGQGSFQNFYVQNFLPLGVNENWNQISEALNAVSAPLFLFETCFM